MHEQWCEVAACRRRIWIADAVWFDDNPAEEELLRPVQQCEALIAHVNGYLPASSWWHGTIRAYRCGGLFRYDYSGVTPTRPTGRGA